MYIPKPDDLVGKRQVYEAYKYQESPSRLACDYLDDLDLDPELDEDNGVRQINFYDGLSPAYDSLLVEATNLFSISFLQKRLNEIDGTVAFKVLGSNELNGREPFLYNLCMAVLILNGRQPQNS